MKISVFTDASVVSDHCGYAFYIGCSAGKIQKAGKLRKRTTHTVLAELHCLANAIHTLKHSRFTPITKVWVYCDQLQVVKVIRGDVRGFKSEEYRSVIDEIHFLMMEICLKQGRSIRDIDKMFEVNHIKAHTGQQDILSKINQWCDVSARKYARKK